MEIGLMEYVQEMENLLMLIEKNTMETGEMT